MADSIELSYYHGGAWTDISELCQEFTVEDYGISKVPSATVKLHSDYTNLLALLASHHYDFRILIKPYGAGTWNRIFYGNIWEPRASPELSNAVKMTVDLDCRSFAQRLADDTVTWDYYALQSAMSPDTLWRYRDVIDDFLLVPDSGYDTGITLVAVNSGNIVLPIDSAATFDRQTLLDALRNICDRIGYDGYFDIDVPATPRLFLYPYGTGGSVATLTHPFLVPPKWSGGSLDDVVNYVLVTGGTDIGIPNDGDKFTEMAYGKYSPKIWTIHTSSGTGTLSDVINSDFNKPEKTYGTNSYCIKGTATMSGPPYYMYIELNPSANAASGTTYFDCKNRLVSFHFHYVGLGISPAGSRLDFLQVSLIDSAGNRIMKYATPATSRSTLFDKEVYYFEAGADKPLGTERIRSSWEAYSDIISWFYDDPSFTTFDWEHIVAIRFGTRPADVSGTATWGLEIDGFQFVGGLTIDPFAEYADTFNPPVKDATSIATYGVHIGHVNDSQISSFEQAQNEGNRILSNLKNPIATLELKQPALLTAVKPSNLVTVTIPQLAISAEHWRVIGEKYEWNSHRKTVHQTHILTKQTNPLPPIWAMTPELRSLVK
jgi:hypothetical protein